MKMTSMLKTPVTITMIVSMLFLSVQTPVMADIVDTKELTMQVELQQQRDAVRELVARDEVRSALLGYGVNPADVDARIDNLTGSELMKIQNQLGDLPAGGDGILSVVLTLIVIFVLLDLLGATDVFPNI
jgi:hypothetical protein